MLSVSRFAAMAVAAAALLLVTAPSHADDAIPGVPRELLEDIATGSRVLADLGVVDAFGHVSARHPTNPKHFLMARSIAPAQVTANDIMEFDENGEPVDAKNRAVSSNASSTPRSTRPARTSTPSCTRIRPASCRSA
jgi:HCOMODA/2-hydroxy-3-carboxy-muconic semialdehyde decarboxylase